MLVNGEALRCTDSFTYLGSAVTNTNSSDHKIERHVQSTCKAFGAEQKCLWSHHDVKLCTKIKVYNTAILLVLLYSMETMTLYRCHLRQLTRTQLQHLWAIMHIKWKERVPDVEVLKRAGTVSAEATITATQLRWAGHVSRMPDDWLSKAVFLGNWCLAIRRQVLQNWGTKMAWNGNWRMQALMFTPGKTKPKTDLAGMASSWSPS